MNAVQQLLTDHIDIWTAAETEKKSGRGRSSGNAASVYGIKKLRELILELAVRGKLVPQDANDEPASELIKRLQAEKLKLIRERNISREKPWAEIKKDEEPFDRPIGWEWARWNQVALKIGDIDHKMPETVANGIPYVSPRDFNGNYIDFENAKKISRDDFLKLSLKIRPEVGDIIFPRYGTIGENVLVITDREFLASYSCAVIKTMNKFIDPKYQFIYSISRLTKKQAKEAENKTTQANVGLKSIQEFLIPIPPLTEQLRIVAKVDELMALCDQLEAQHSDAADAHEQLVSHLLGTLTQSQSAADFNANWQRIAAHFDTLFTTEASIDALKQTLLQLAVMGKLVAQDANDEPASELLKRLQIEKSKLVAKGEIKKDKPIAVIAENEKPFELPEGWEWIRVATISKMITSGSRDWAQYLSEHGAKFITMGNLSRGNYELRLNNIRYVNPPKTGEGSRTRLEADDVLVSITGEVGNLGRIPENFGEAYINQHTCVLRFLPQCKNRYFPEALRSPMALKQFNAPQRGIKNSFRLGDLAEMVLPLPPLPEQYRIVAKIDELMELCDQLILHINVATQYQKKLADVLIDDAVAGSDAEWISPRSP